jgi:kynurenine formamidase
VLSRRAKAESMTALSCEFASRRYQVGSKLHDLSIAIGFGSAQLECFGAPGARQQALRLGGFVGDVREGGSCNCATLTITPHCNGTHTEGVGHLTGERLNVREACRDALVPALLITILPERASSVAGSNRERIAQPDDLLITRDALQSSVQALSRKLDLAMESRLAPALIIRTLPNDESKRTRQYSRDPAPYFTAEAMRWVVDLGVDHLVVDLPSLDRAEDQGLLTAHRVFWNVPARATLIDANTRTHATVTELAYIDDEIRDDLYLLNLQIAPLDGDAVPSRPLLMALEPL